MPEMPDRPDLKDKRKQNRALEQLRVLDECRRTMGDPKKRAAAHDKLKRIEAAYETD